MAILCKPAVSVPDHVITLEETLALARTRHADHPRLPLALRLIENTGVRTRRLVRPLAETLEHPGFAVRNKVYESEAKARVPRVVGEALDHGGLAPDDIDLLVYVSCTGFIMPSLTAWLINTMGFRPTTRQLPIAQLGCAAGAAAVNRAHDFCAAYPDRNALVVACEFCSLCYQPTDLEVGSLLSNGLFGDGVAAAVVRGTGGHGIRLERNGSYLVPDTEGWIAYDVRATGFHFLLDRRVPGTMEFVAPALRDLTDGHGWEAGALDFLIVHAGGPRILDDLCRFLGVPPGKFRFSRATLTEYGNIASAAVLDAVRRFFDAGGATERARGLIAGFGPGITAEMTLGRWTEGGTPGTSDAQEVKEAQDAQHAQDARGAAGAVPRVPLPTPAPPGVARPPLPSAPEQETR
ncbi:1,3,6,8-tetrahydroxynaphthalene synthase [Streptomyces longispororuber]|uniref:1,3,6,8-tetrahydroxynaphthalene synthase n=1 Tax=Streptomyces longispororuber TaxID=68230 RepID=A0A919DW83_9ACTN|nr:type III polyketide synthase [Streptomyces longispororuber]GHE90922.1 1,3,6,8-tetrahydroxynaphthalene synthase [Streptomyces longispororuber]